MRIAMITWEYPPHVVGGLGTYAGALVPALRAAGHDVQVFAAFRGHAAPQSQGVHWTTPLDLSPTYPHVFDAQATGWGPFFGELYATNLLWADALRRADDAAPFDVVAVHDWLAAPAALILRDRLRGRLAFHVHSTEWGRQAQSPSPVVLHWEEAVGRQADAVITVSNAMRADLIAHGWTRSRVHAIWNGVDTRTYAPDSPGREAVRARYGLDEGAPVALFIGRLTAVKGVLQLAQAWPAVAARSPAARLIVLGSGELEGAVRETLAAAGVADTVILRTEFVSEGERIAHYLAGDVAVLPSTYEPFGIVGVEAMACGRPAVVGARGVVGLREQIVPAGPDQSGLHVNGHDPADIAWGLHEALSNLGRLRRWGASARARAAAAFTWERVAAATLEVYAGITAAAS